MPATPLPTVLFLVITTRLYHPSFKSIQQLNFIVTYTCSPKSWIAK